MRRYQMTHLPNEEVAGSECSPGSRAEQSRTASQTIFCLLTCLAQVGETVYSCVIRKTAHRQQIPFLAKLAAIQDKDAWLQILRYLRCNMCIFSHVLTDSTGFLQCGYSSQFNYWLANKMQDTFHYYQDIKYRNYHVIKYRNGKITKENKG